MNIEADSVKLIWTRPEVPEGEKLLDYSLWYTTANGTSTNSQENLLVIKGDDTQIILRGLTADTFYRLRLAGRSSKGHGTAAAVEFHTKEHCELLTHCHLSSLPIYFVYCFVYFLYLLFSCQLLGALSHFK